MSDIELTIGEKMVWAAAFAVSASKMRAKEAVINATNRHRTDRRVLLIGMHHDDIAEMVMK